MHDVAAGSRFLPGPVWQQHGGIPKAPQPDEGCGAFPFRPGICGSDQVVALDVLEIAVGRYAELAGGRIVADQDAVRVHLQRRDGPLVVVGSLHAVADGTCDRGVVICTTGIGVSIAANKVPGIRCALCTDSLQAEMTRRHNDANMMALGAGITGGNLAKRMVEIFLHTEFEGGRHARRVALLDAIQ